MEVALCRFYACISLLYCRNVELLMYSRYFECLDDVLLLERVEYNESHRSLRGICFLKAS